MDHIIKSLAQPSTYAGLSGIALAVGVSAPLWSAFAAAAAAVFGLIAVIVHEQGSGS